MERIAFLVERSGERIRCLLNPENLVMRRAAGVRPRRSVGGTLTGAGLADEPLLYTGGGRTELELKLLFDVLLAGSSINARDVRELTSPLWKLSENEAGEEAYGQPPLVRLVWGKGWNVPGVVAAVAERLEHFTADGTPTRSWMRMRFLRVAEPARPAPAPGTQAPSSAAGAIANPAAAAKPTAQAATAAESLSEVGARAHQTSAGERLDQVASNYYGAFGDPSLWRPLAEFNGVGDPLRIPAGTVLRVPKLSALGGQRSE